MAEPTKLTGTPEEQADQLYELAEANLARREQRFLIMGALLGAVVLVFLARLFGAERELVLLGAAVVGLLVGWLVSLLVFSATVRRRTTTSTRE